MSLLFASTVGNASVNCGSKSLIDTLDPWTLLLWLYPINGGADAWLAQKGAAGTGSRRIDIRRAGGSTTEIGVYADRATTDLDFVTNTTPIIIGNWTCIGVTFNSNGGAGELVNIYAGDLRKPLAECGYGTATDGAGAFASDASEDLMLGNYKALAGPARGLISYIALYKVVLPFGTMQSWQWNPRVLPGCVGFWQLGKLSAGIQLDESGYGNHGTVTGATLSWPEVPIVRNERRNWFYVPEPEPVVDLNVGPFQDVVIR